MGEAEADAGMGLPVEADRGDRVLGAEHHPAFAGLPLLRGVSLVAAAEGHHGSVEADVLAAVGPLVLEVQRGVEQAHLLRLADGERLELGDDPLA